MLQKGILRPDGTPVDADGQSLLPDGVQDYAALGEDAKLDEALEEQVQGLLDQELQSDKSKAKFKLEVVFAESRSKIKPYMGIVYAWTNGGFAHGGGDEVVYFCSGKVVRNGEEKSCNAPIDLKFVSREHAVCVACKTAVDPKTLTGQVVAKLTAQSWSKLITRMFLLLEANADVRMGMMPGDLHRAASTEQERSMRGDVLNRVRHQRTWVHYPLTDIIKDTSNGSSLAKRIQVFLEA
jgi:hypothetical protein